MFLLASWFLLAGWATIAHGECRRPKLQLLRYQEDWSSLRDPKCRTHVFDPVKYQPLGSRAYVSFGGEIRQWYEHYHNPDWGRLPQDKGYSLQRYLAHADLHIGPRFRAFTQLGSHLAFGRADGPRPEIDEDQLDLQQAFVELSFEIRGAGTIGLRAGRQELEYADARLVAVRENANVRLRFGGLRTMQKFHQWQLDTFVLTPIEVNPGVFDDKPTVGQTNGQTFWGVYAFGPLLIRALQLDAYYLGLRRREVTFAQGTAPELRHTLGTRLSGTSAGVEYNVEGMYQTGSFGVGRINAWSIGSLFAYNLEHIATRPRLGTQLNTTSGDKNPRSPNLQTFDPLFPRQAYFSQAALIGPLNHIDLHPFLDLHPTENILLRFDWDFFWRYSAADALYRPSGQPQVEPNSARYVGSQGEVVVRWLALPGLDLNLVYSYFFAGPFLKRADLDRDVGFVAVWVRARI